jgi:hypothetical protein
LSHTHASPLTRTVDVLDEPQRRTSHRAGGALTRPAAEGTGTPLKKVLIVAYHFPPDAAVGALRTRAFAKYLPLYGWEPYVLTVHKKYYPLLDASRCDEDITSSGRVFRTGMVVHPSVAYRRLKAACYAPAAREAGGLQGGKDDKPAVEGVFRRARRLLSSLASIPDETLGWLPEGVVKAVRLIRRHQINQLYTTGPPHTVHLMGLAIKKMTGVPWVADFRDPWAWRCRNDPAMPARLTTWLEGRVVANADQVVTTTDRMTRGFQDAYAPVVSPQHFLTILNGYNAEDFSGVERHRRERFRIMYLGSLYQLRTPEPLFDALRELLAERKVDPDHLDVQLVGECEYANGRRVSDLIESRGLARVVHVAAPVSHKAAVEHMTNCDLLLLLAPDQPYMIPAKVFEYLASGTDILALTEDGATGDLMGRFQRSVQVHPQDVEGIKKAVAQRYEMWMRGRSPAAGIPPPDVQRYERKELTRELSSVLDRCVISA